MAITTIKGTLIISAHALSERLGHVLEPWVRVDNWETVTFCTSCLLAAVVNTNPAIHSEPVYGSAVEVRCQGRGTVPTWAPQL